MADEALEVGRRLRRREFLIAGAGAGLALASPINFAGLARARALPPATGAKFAYGVASGIPSQGAITLWTRLKGLDRTSRLTRGGRDRFRLSACRQPARRPRRGGPGLHGAYPGRRPQPGEPVLLPLRDRGQESRVGELPHAAPRGLQSAAPDRLLLVPELRGRLLHGPRGARQGEDLDLVLCLGDYIYEHHYYDGPTADESTRPAANQRRRRPDARRVPPEVPLLPERQEPPGHARGASLCRRSGTTTRSRTTTPARSPTRRRPIPHHFENNNSYPRRVPFGQRRKNGYKAFFEAMPRIQLHANPNRLYGSFRLGEDGRALPDR